MQRTDARYTNGDWKLPTRTPIASRPPREPVGGSVLEHMSAGKTAHWTRLNAEVREATKHG